jgi:hypothetical protein
MIAGLQSAHAAACAADGGARQLPPETELTVHFYGHGAKLYENSIVVR